MNCERRTNALEIGRSASLRRSFARGRLVRRSLSVPALRMSSPIPGSWKQTSRFSWAYCFQTGITHRPVRARRRHSPEHMRTYPGGAAEAKCVSQITVTFDVRDVSEWESFRCHLLGSFGGQCLTRQCESVFEVRVPDGGRVNPFVVLLGWGRSSSWGKAAQSRSLYAEFGCAHGGDTAMVERAEGA